MVNWLNNKLALVWLFLAGATLASAWISETGSPAVFVLGLAFTKVYLVMRYFMELDDSPRLWHGLFLAWTLLTFITLLAMIEAR